MAPLLLKHRLALRELCERYGVRRLDAIGSAVRDDFDPRRSDVDLVVEFKNLTPSDGFDRHFGLLNDLEDLLERPVDLISYPAIRNPFFKAVVDRSRTSLYAA